MYPEAIQRYSREKNLSLQDAAQTFLQVIVLKHLRTPRARFMGGTALVLGYGNPRFSEDIDLTQVDDPAMLRPNLVSAVAELEGWFASPVTLAAPKKDGRTWRLTVKLGRADSLRLHIDSQGFPAQSSQPLVIEYPSIPSFVVEALSLDEIMAEKVIAVAYRRYLGGRDLFDLWFHWLRSSEAPPARPTAIFNFIEKKLRDRGLSALNLRRRLAERLGDAPALARANAEWKRYLPRDFQTPGVLDAVISSCKRLPELIP
jgi:predicted nucleotidyltransferase component of viral defense system